MALGKKTGGRAKGTPNKTTGAVKEMILEALDRSGGVDYLIRQADENPTAFMTLVGKVLPMQTELSGPNGAPIRTEIGLDMTGLSTEALRELSKLPLK